MHSQYRNAKDVRWIKVEVAYPGRMETDLVLLSKKVQSQLGEEHVNPAIQRVRNLINFLSLRNLDVSNFEAKDFFDYSSNLVERGEDGYYSYYYLQLFGQVTGNDQLVVSTMEITDGFEMMINFSERLRQWFGDEVHTKVFSDLELPKPGLHPSEKAEMTLALIEKLLEVADNEEVRKFLNAGLRDRYTSWYDYERKTYLKSHDLEDYISRRRANFLLQMQQHNQEGSLFFTQPITNEVLDFVNSDPSISAGVVEDDVIRLRKIPYMTNRYLEAMDAGDHQEMAYQGCHNPWIRQAIRDGKIIDPIVCEISCGFLKDFWEGILHQPVNVEVTESLIRGGESCYFSISPNL